MQPNIISDIRRKRQQIKELKVITDNYAEIYYFPLFALRPIYQAHSHLLVSIKLHTLFKMFIFSETAKSSFVRSLHTDSLRLAEPGGQARAQSGRTGVRRRCLWQRRIPEGDCRLREAKAKPSPSLPMPWALSAERSSAP